MGGPEMAPHTPQRSGRLGKAAASLDIPPYDARAAPAKAAASLDILPSNARAAPAKAAASLDILPSNARAAPAKPRRPSISRRPTLGPPRQSRGVPRFPPS
jgi:hypothetical protein